MGIRSGAAKFVSAAGTFALRNVFHRPAANFPGKVALYVDPRIIANTSRKLRCGSVCVVGTNGKTTITNMLADCMEAAGMRVVCNRTGANLDSGIATSLLQASESDWGVFECDELWLAKALPQLQSKYVLLLNLFRDQLDRVGEVSRIQESIVSAFAASPETVLVYNADDPMCETIARRVSNPKIPIGIGEDLGLPLAGPSDVRICQQCSGAIEYNYRQYSQLGEYHCAKCDYGRSPLAFAARNCRVDGDGMAFDVAQAADGVPAEVAIDAPEPKIIAHIEADYSGAYMVYNLLTVYTAAHLMGAPNDKVIQAMRDFDPRNGRLQTLQVRGREVMLNLAKNPTGFNQNLDLVAKAKGRRVAAFFVNDMEGDGRDVSWLWDIDFESLAADEDLIVFVGGMRANDLQVRMKYAGVNARIIANSDEAMAYMAKLPADFRLFMIANYTALPPIHERMTQIAAEANPVAAIPQDVQAAEEFARELAKRVESRAECGFPAFGERPLRIGFALPQLLNLCGDSGNAKVLAQRCAWRGIPVETVEYGNEGDCDLDSIDILVVAGGPEREQIMACDALSARAEELTRYVEAGGAMLAVGGGLQILGQRWKASEGIIDGVGLLGIEEDASCKGSRLIGDVMAQSQLAKHPIVAFRNDSGCIRPVGDVSRMCTISVGPGAHDGMRGADGLVCRSVLGSSMHGPLLPKNPELADWLIARAIERRIGGKCRLEALDDTEELQANAFIFKRLSGK